MIINNDYFQEKLQNSFRQATSKISATIGLGLPREDNIEVTVDTNNAMADGGDDDMVTIDADAVTDNDE